VSGSAATVTAAAQPAITSVGTLTGLTVTNTITGSVSGSAATAGTVTTAAQPNITSVGTLTGLSVSGNIGIGDSTPLSRLQVGTNTFDGTNGMFVNGRVGISNHGSLTGLMLASTYNDATFPEYGLVFVQGPTTANYNVWSISPDGPAKGNRLNFIYQSNSANIHTASPRVVFNGNGNVGIGTSDPSNPLDVNGIARIRTGLHVNNWIEVDVTGSFAANTWYNTGIARTSVPGGGIYLLNVWADTYFSGQSYQESYTGVFVLPNRGTNSTVADVITVHRCGHAPNSETFQFRTLRTPNADSNIYLQWLSNFALSLNATSGRRLRIGIARLSQPIFNG
jgi:hypothetical protein